MPKKLVVLLSLLCVCLVGCGQSVVEERAEAGDAGAQYLLGLMYKKGKGVPQDDNEAAKWFRLAADQGDAEAQFYLGVSYDKGEGVPQDYKEALKSYRLAADQGLAEAQVNLALMYANGKGVMHDDVMAYVWTNVAAANGNELASENTQIYAKRLDKPDLRKAQKLSRRCLKKPASCPKYSY